MGQKQSKDELLFQQVSYGNSEAIRTLRTEGAGLEWSDGEGRTPLIVASMSLQLYDVAKTLVELGANVNAYRPGRQAGTPLHHAAKRGLEQTVKLLLSHGANALVINDDCQTPLDIARSKGYTNVVRAIEEHLCLFSGWLRELYGPGFLELLAPQLLSRKVWVVVLPCGSRTLRKPFKLELAIYAGPQYAQPRTIVPLWKANLEEPNFNHPDPAAVISDISRIPRRWKRRRGIKSSQEARCTRIKLAPVHESEKQELQRLCNACKGIPQMVHPLFPFNNQPPTAPVAPPTSEENAAHETPSSTDSDTGSETDTSASLANLTTSPDHETGHFNGASTSQGASQSKCQAAESDSMSFPPQHHQSQYMVPSVVQTTPYNPPPPVSIPSAPETDAAIDDGPIHYPSIDVGPVDLSSPIIGATPTSGDKKIEDNTDYSTCTICLDAPLEGACVPCGHMSGCMSCLNEIKDKKWGCPVCRAKIDQVIRIYAA